MNIVTSKLQEFFEKRWVVVTLAMLAFTADTAAVYTIVKPTGFGTRTIFVATGSIFSFGMLCAVAYSVIVRQRYLAFKTLPESIHRVNHEYRNVLSKVFGQPELPSELDRANLELTTVHATCQRIADIFVALTQSKCMVTVKLVTRDDSQNKCQTYARSETKCKRDEVPKAFAIGTGANTAFDEALKVQQNTTAHFFSADLDKDRKGGRYFNERQGWEFLYRSVIVVPIRYADPERLGQPGSSDLIGFLAVDTKSTNVLNNGHHVELMASFADQMYNFMSLMRGKYGVPRQT